MTAVKETAKSLGVFNSHDLARQFSGDDPPVMVYYRPQQLGRAYQCAAWIVIHLEHKTDPTGGHWRDYGNKTFNVFSRAEKAPQFENASLWASRRYGVAQWARGPFGDYHPAGTMVRFKAAVKAHQKAAREGIDL